MIRHHGEHGQLEGTEEGAGITVSATGWRGVRMVRHNRQRGRFECSEHDTS